MWPKHPSRHPRGQESLPSFVEETYQVAPTMWELAVVSLSLLINIDFIKEFSSLVKKSPYGCQNSSHLGQKQGEWELVVHWILFYIKLTPGAVGATGRPCCLGGGCFNINVIDSKCSQKSNFHMRDKLKPAREPKSWWHRQWQPLGNCHLEDKLAWLQWDTGGACKQCSPKINLRACCIFTPVLQSELLIYCLLTHCP